MRAFAAVILAAGKAARYREAGGVERTKLVATLDGQALVRHVTLAALASTARPVLIVTGHARSDLEEAVAELPVTCIHNPYFAEGLSTSLKAGIGAVPPACAGAVILLADMPVVDGRTIDALIQGARARPSCDAVVPVHHRQRGNPVLISRSVFARVAALRGDVGARRLLSDPNVSVEEIALTADILDDVDRPEDLAALHRRRASREGKGTP